MIWKASKISNDIKFCREAKTIIVVDIWFNSLCGHLPTISCYLKRQWKKESFFWYVLKLYMYYLSLPKEIIRFLLQLVSSVSVYSPIIMPGQLYCPIRTWFVCWAILPFYNLIGCRITHQELHTYRQINENKYLKSCDLARLHNTSFLQFDWLYK